MKERIRSEVGLRGRVIQGFGKELSEKEEGSKGTVTVYRSRKFHLMLLFLSVIKLVNDTRIHMQVSKTSSFVNDLLYI